MHKWFVYDNFEDASLAAAEFLATLIEASIHDKEECHVALPGGESPARCLSLLAKNKLDWTKVHWYLGDERCYPKGHPDRNDVMLQENLWSKIGETNIHLIPTEKGAEQAAEIYRELISTVDYFDIVFLGMGPDGHTASLFPDNEALADTRSVIPVYHSPKEPSDRVTLSIETIKKAKTRIVLTSGVAKAPVINRIKQGEALPINCIGELNWFVDKNVLSGSTK